MLWLPVLPRPCLSLGQLTSALRDTSHAGVPATPAGPVPFVLGLGVLQGLPVGVVHRAVLLLSLLGPPLQSVTGVGLIVYLLARPVIRQRLRLTNVGGGLQKRAGVTSTLLLGAPGLPAHGLVRALGRDSLA